MENKQTAVEWLTEKFTECGFTFSGNIFEQAKKMEEEQMENLRPQIISNCVIKEIADEDIKRRIKKEYNYTHYEDRLWMVQGAIWYREQLKKQQ